MRARATCKPAEIKSKDKWFKAKVPAKVVGDIEKVEGSYTVELNIGSDQPVYCEIMPEGFDMADMIRRNLEFTMGQVAEAQGKVEARSLESIDAGVFGNVPYLQTQWLYRVNDGTAQRLGGFKQISMEKNDKGIYCAHVDLGYTQSFAALAKAFAETFESTTDAPAAVLRGNRRRHHGRQENRRCPHHSGTRHGRRHQSRGDYGHARSPSRRVRCIRRMPSTWNGSARTPR